MYIFYHALTTIVVFAIAALFHYSKTAYTFF